MSAEGPLRHRNSADFDLIETLRWEPAGGFVRLDRHLARLGKSAAQLGFALDQALVRAKLGLVGRAGPQRVRLTLARAGDVAVSAHRYEPLPENSVWRIGIADTRIDSTDPLLRHKTTRREVYAAARAERPVSDADEMILLNERGDVCEGTITTVFVNNGDGGPLLTPPLSCGLLAGVLREEMIEEGRAREASLTFRDLRTARNVFVGNSLRGLMRADLSPDQN